MLGKQTMRIAAVTCVALMLMPAGLLAWGRGGSVSHSRSSSFSRGGGSISHSVDRSYSTGSGYGVARSTSISAATYRPYNYGSLSHSSSYAGTRVYRPSGIQEGSGGGAAVVHERPGGGGSAWVRGPAGGTAGAVVGPEGGAIAGARGVYGTTAGAYRAPYGSWGGAVRGPAGNAVGVFHGPAGGTVAGVRGPYGAGVVAALPSGYTSVAWRGSNYYYHGYNFYRPYWYGGSICYWPVSPPIGWHFASLPGSYVVVVLGGTTYYYSDGVYYTEGTQDGKKGYVVAEDPNPSAQPATPDPSQPQFVTAAPDPFKTLRKMSDFLGRQASFTLELNDTFDEVTDVGAKVQLSAKRTVRVQRPDRLAVDFTGEQTKRHVVYDGKTLTALDVAQNGYATIDIPGPLDNMLDTLARNYGMAQPAGELLYKDIYSRVYPRIEAGQYVGIDAVAGVKCDHLAFRQQGIDWEIWIQQGDHPLPRKLSLVHTDLPSKPRYTIEVSQWDAGPIQLAAFAIQLPKDCQKIDVLKIAAETKAAP